MPLDLRCPGQTGPADLAAAARFLRAGLALAASLWLSACALPPAEPTLPPSYPAPVTDAIAPRAPALPPEAEAAPPPPPSPTVLESVLANAERLRSLAPAELSGEIARLGDAASSPQQQVQLALLLLQTRQPVDTARALGLLQRVAGSDSAQAMGLRPLARLLVSRVQDVRRLEEQQDRQSQQLRDAQRRIDVLNERLEAMREIERSLGPRPPAPVNGRPAP